MSARLSAVAVVLAACVPLVGGGTAEGAPAPRCLGRPATHVVPPGSRSFEGTDRADVIVGSSGDDIILALEGNDRVCARSGDDIVFGNEGNDLLDGGAGGDAFVGGPGADLLDGGRVRGFDALDLVTYELSGAPVTVDLAAGRAAGEGADRLRSIEILGGTKFGDALTGNSATNFFFPAEGNDTVRGAGGFDFAFFSRSVQASLLDQKSTGEGVDRLVALEGLVGCQTSRAGGCPLAQAGDVLTGDGRGNYLAGGDGDDVIDAGAGDDRAFGDSGDDTISTGAGIDTVGGDAGNDRLDAGAGIQDSVSYLTAPEPIELNLVGGEARGEGADELTGVEGATGSAFADSFTGDEASNLFFGNGGNDGLFGAGGADFLGGGGGRDTIDDGAGDDYCVEAESGSGCETSGLPGPLPGRPERPPIGAPVERPPGPTPKPLTSPSPLLARVLFALHRFLRGPSSEDWAAASLAGRTAAYEYVGVPTCFARTRPSSTAIAPPKRVEPIGRDGKPEEAWWKGTLYRENPRTRRWEKFKQTAWARAQIAGGYAQAGLAVWQNVKRRGFTGRLSYSVPAGRFAWVGQITWERSGGSIYRWIEPNIDFAPDARPRKFCAVGG